MKKEEGRNAKEKAAGEEIYSSRMQAAFKSALVMRVAQKWVLRSTIEIQVRSIAGQASCWLPAVSQIMGLFFP